MPNNTNRLTPKQIECLTRVAEGLTSKEIARELGVSARTVDDHIDKARIKLGASTRQRAAALFRIQLNESETIIASPHEVARDFEQTRNTVADDIEQKIEVLDPIIAPEWAPDQLRCEPQSVDGIAAKQATDGSTPRLEDSGIVHFEHFPKVDMPQRASITSQENRHPQSSSLTIAGRILIIAAALSLIVLSYPQLVHGAEAIAAFILKATSVNRGAASSR